MFYCLKSCHMAQKSSSEGWCTWIYRKGFLGWTSENLSDGLHSWALVHVSILSRQKICPIYMIFLIPRHSHRGRPIRNFVCYSQAHCWPLSCWWVIMEPANTLALYQIVIKFGLLSLLLLAWKRHCHHCYHRHHHHHCHPIKTRSICIEISMAKQDIDSSMTKRGCPRQHDTVSVKEFDEHCFKAST